MRRCIITAVFAAVTLVGTTNPAVSFAPTTTAAPSGGSRHCPDSHVLVDSAPLVTEEGQRLGIAKLFAGQSTQSELPSPGFCFEVVVKAVPARNVRQLLRSRLHGSGQDRAEGWREARNCCGERGPLTQRLSHSTGRPSPRAISIRCTSEVPSPISSTLASR
jgi:hypothetical protein